MCYRLPRPLLITNTNSKQHYKPINTYKLDIDSAMLRMHVTMFILAHCGLMLQGCTPDENAQTNASEAVSDSSSTDDQQDVSRAPVVAAVTDSESETRSAPDVADRVDTIESEATTESAAEEGRVGESDGTGTEEGIFSTITHALGFD